MIFQKYTANSVKWLILEQKVVKLHSSAAKAAKTSIGTFVVSSNNQAKCVN
jgi:hypothetical protein